jgi:hypothetical protein
VQKVDSSQVRGRVLRVRSGVPRVNQGPGRARSHTQTADLRVLGTSGAVLSNFTSHAIDTSASWMRLPAMRQGQRGWLG